MSIDNEAVRRLEQAVADVAQEMRQEFADCNMPHMAFRATVDGRPDGELRILYRVGTYGHETVDGDNVADVLKEFFRRQGWETKHAGLRLTYQGEVEK